MINDSNGLITNYADITGMAQNMEAIYKNYEKYNPKKISQDAMSKFSGEAIVPMMIEHYKNVIATT